MTTATTPLTLGALPADRGLPDALAEQRLAAEGPNELPQEQRRGWIRLFAEVVREPMIALLLMAAGLYLFLGDLQEAIILAASVGLVIGLTLYQENRAERAVASLRSLSSPRALVWRSGRALRITGRDVVRGDWIFLNEGDRVPADGELREATNLLIDESLLTGESVPVRKQAAETTAWLGDSAGGMGAKPVAAVAGGDDQPSVFSGTMVVRGHGIVEISATGPRTQFGAIGRALEEVEVERTPLQQQVRRLVRVFFVTGAALCTLLVLWLGWLHGRWIDAALAGLGLAISLLPEEFPVVLTVFLALGAWRISKRGVLARKIPAVETLGAASILCVDKTGTLTENRMRLGHLWTPDSSHVVDERPLPETVHPLLEFAILASQRDPFDPMEIAINGLGTAKLAGTEHLHATWEVVREYALSPQLLSMAQVWRTRDGNRLAVAAKGAPEAIVDLCHLDATAAAAITAAVSEMASAGQRVLGVAECGFTGEALPEGQHDFAFRFVGLIGLADPVRAEVPGAVAACRSAGIRVLMITGDYPETARAIGRQAGLDADEVLTGAEIAGLDDTALQGRLAHCSIVARAVPEHKLRIVRALKAAGEIVAMTGDGVNDAPALKAAHIGVAMGGRGTDVAREAAALVLTDDNFASIVEAIRLGRRIFANISRASAYILAVHVTIAGATLVPALLGWPLALLPIHLVFLELIIDPACSISFEAEPEDPGIMRQPPRSLHTPILPWRHIYLGLSEGAVLMLATVLVFGMSLRSGHPDDVARALAFVTLIAGNLTMILANRSRSHVIMASLKVPNPAMWMLLSGTSVLLTLILSVPSARQLFHFGPVAPAAAAVAVLLGISSVVLVDLFKLLVKHSAG